MWEAEELPKHIERARRLGYEEVPGELTMEIFPLFLKFKQDLMSNMLTFNF